MDTSPTPPERAVIKLGGSLFDLPDLAERITALVDSLSQTRCVIVAGGGHLANVVREWDSRFSLGQETAHQLALGAMSLSARFVAALSPRFLVVTDFTSQSLSSTIDSSQKNDPTDSRRIPVLDAATGMLNGCGPLGDLPHSWDVTSDSIAARCATELHASRLILAKSIPCPMGSVDEAAGQDLVDARFPQAAGRLRVDWINLRCKPLVLQRWQ